MRALLLPIKDLRLAKQRLAGALTAEERAGLMRAMMDDAFRAVQGARRAERVYVVTNDSQAMEAAREAGWETLREAEQLSESVSVDWASQQCAKFGVTSLLRLPVDLPLVRAEDIDELLSANLAAPSAVLVASRDGTGTNALLRTPPDLFPSHFGVGSFGKHRAEAERAGAAVVVKRNARLELDVDDADDLFALLAHDLSATATGRWLRRSGVAERISRAIFHTAQKAHSA